MLLKAYPLLSSASKRALKRTKRSFGKPYSYVPRGALLERLAKKLFMSKEEIYSLLMKEREYLISLEKGKK
ncbi:MAG: hypothetical protein AUK48_02370 [Oscillatoriales cyanobacterium CG2_30_44_21]|nr:MAG: hypothetical protein AUK48_02370 [Oscillatoriales cyanobacterium CG2_30_44_21]